MAAIITDKLRIFSAQQFKEALSEQAETWQPSTAYEVGKKIKNDGNLYLCVTAGISGTGIGPQSVTSTEAESDGSVEWVYINRSMYNNVFVALGKWTEWNDDSVIPEPEEFEGDEGNPPSPTDTVENESFSLANVITAQLIDPKAVSLAIPRIDWEDNATYTMYQVDKETPIIPDTYVVVPSGASQYSIFKCLNNKVYDPNTRQMVVAESEVRPFEENTNGVSRTSDGYVWKYMYSVPATAVTLDYVPVEYLESVPNDEIKMKQWNVQENAKKGQVEFVSVDVSGQDYLHNILNVGVNYVNLNDNIIRLNVGTINPAYVGYGVILGGNYNKIKEINGADIVLESLQFGSSYVQTGETISIAPVVETVGDGEGFCAYGVVRPIDSSRGDLVSVEIVDGGQNYTWIKGNIQTGLNGVTKDAVITVQTSPQDGHGGNPVEELGGYYVMINVRFEYDGSDYLGKPFLPVAGDRSKFRQVSLLADIKDVDGKLATSKYVIGKQHPYFNENEESAFYFENRLRMDSTEANVLYNENRQVISRADDQIEDIRIVLEF